MDVVSNKITLLISSLAGGGAEGVCVNVANGLAECGWQVDLVVLHTNNAAYLERVSQKVNLVVLGVNHARNAPLPLLLYIRKHKPEKLLVFNYELAAILVILRSIFRFNIKIIARNISTFSLNYKQDKSSWYRAIVRSLIVRLYCKVDHVVNQCHAMCEDLVSFFPQLKNKSSVIYNPVAKHIEDFANDCDFSKVKKRGYFLCVGRLEKVKAFHHAIVSFASIADEYPNLRLKIVGQGSLEKKLKQCAVDLGIENRVDFEGFQKNILPYYLHAKATLLTSLYEGFPNALVESITLGTPVIAVDCPSGPDEIIIMRKNGMLVKTNDIEQFSNALRDSIENSFDSYTVNETSHKFFIDRIIFDWNSLLKAF